jgi:23S rRNA (cytidine1920-2'-O)/16S rRNA (cytidine1409-2'-O)-methyltransferase
MTRIVSTAGRDVGLLSLRGITPGRYRVPCDGLCSLHVVVTRRRLDAELVRRGLAASRNEARDVVATGYVTVGGAPALKPDRMVAPAEDVVVRAPARRFVGRGGDKLDAALSAFTVSVEGRRVLDAGASTGGFTDCLLQRGATSVIAVDVGHGQLDSRLANDERVVVRDRTNIRHVVADDVGGPVDVVVADLSFISLRTVLDALIGVCRPGGDLVLLVKPQFEAGRIEASRGRGVIRDDAVRERVRDEIDAALRDRGATVHGWIESPIAGGDGNREWLVHATAPVSG